MKQMYKDLQKQHMKQLKEETKSPQEGVKEIRSKGFVSQCLLKVDYQGDTVADVDELQVREINIVVPFPELVIPYSRKYCQSIW